MTIIRKIEIKNFRSIKSMAWVPSEGINCLIGPGDSGKSTVLAAIDACLGARRTLQFRDVDFYKLDVESAIEITITLGDLSDDLKNIENYGLFLRNFNSRNGAITDETLKGCETVLSLRLMVDSDLEPQWSLLSDRATAHGLSKNLSWRERLRLAPTHIGELADGSLSWRSGSLLNRLQEEAISSSAALADAARAARASFGGAAEEQLAGALQKVTEAARQLGVPIGGEAKALLDIPSVALSRGAIALHSQDGIPLSVLGTGSRRLLTAGIQRKVAPSTNVILMDELEYGLEPHRIIRLIDLLGAKKKTVPQQAFVTTHSPTALKELSGEQLFIVRNRGAEHHVLNVGTEDDFQGTIRTFPEAFLASSVIVCEGSSEVGLLRGLSQFRAALGGAPIEAYGTILVDGQGGSPDKLIERALAFVRLGYRAALFRDDDKRPDADVEKSFHAKGGETFRWNDGWAIEDALFQGLSNAGVLELIGYAMKLHSDARVDEHVRSVSSGRSQLAAVLAEGKVAFGAETRRLLGAAARNKSNPWFKKLRWMEDIGRDIVGPEIAKDTTTQDFRAVLIGCFGWLKNGDG